MNEWSFSQLLCTYNREQTVSRPKDALLGMVRLDDTAFQTHDSTFERWQSEVVRATSRSRKLSTIGPEPANPAWLVVVITAIQSSDPAKHEALT